MAHSRNGGGPERARRFMEVVKEGMRLGGVREESRSQMEAPEGKSQKQKKKEKVAVHRFKTVLLGFFF